MYLTKDGYKLTGDEVELPDESVVTHGWLLTILDENKKEIAKEVLYKGTPTENIQLYWIKRYEGKFCIVNRIGIFDEMGSLPFSQQTFFDE